MLLLVRKTLAGQLAALLLFAALAVAMELFASYHPPLRFTAGNLVRGVLGGLFACTYAGFLWGALLALIPKRTRDCLATTRSLISSQSSTHSAGTAVSTAAGEEFFLRGYLFGYLLWDTPAFAYILTALITATLYFRGRKDLPATFVRTAESLYYCLLFAVQHSITLNVVARLVQSGVSSYILNSTSAARFIERPLSWRLFYGIADDGRRAIRRV